MNKYKSDNISVKIPEFFMENLKKCLKLHSPNFKFKYDIDYFAYISNRIIHIKSFKKFTNLNKIPISSIVLRYEMGRHYKRYFEYLIKYKFIETDNQYYVTDESKGREGKCKCYRLSDKYEDNNYVKYEITKKSLLSKLIAWKEKKFDKIADDKELSHYYSMMEKIKVNMDEAKPYLDKALKDKVLNKQKYNIELAKCERINDSDEPNNLFISKDDYGRVHTNFTNISKHIRENFLYMDNEKLVHLDIISCQPAMLHDVFQDHVAKIKEILKMREEDEYYTSPYEVEWRRPDVRDKYVNSQNYYTGDNIYSNEFMHMISMHGYSTYEELLEDVEHELLFYENVLQHDIYEFFRDKWEVYYGGDKTRSDIKHEWMVYVFGRNNTPGHEKFDNIWKNEFPALCLIMKHFKKYNHKPLAHELQRKESSLIYKKVCPAIDDANIDYVTVHDCVVVKESVADDVYDIFENVLENNDVVTGVDYDA